MRLPSLRNSFIPTQIDVRLCQVVERLHHLVGELELLANLVSLLIVGECVLTPRVEADRAEVVETLCLLRLITQLTEQCQCVVRTLQGIFVSSPIDLGESSMWPGSVILRIPSYTAAFSHFLSFSCSPA